MRWKYTVNDIIHNNWNTITKLNINTHQIRHLHNISNCHTPALGRTRIQCKQCSHLQYQYHSCRNRHCPSCQGSKREEWIDRQQKYLLDVPYFHVVFTLPEQLRPLCLFKPRILYNLLFKAAWQTINTLSKDSKFLGAQTGMTAVQHTWSQNLGLHPHLHCIIPAGGLTDNKKWKATRSNGNYLFPRKIMKPIFKGIFMKELKSLHKQGLIKLDDQLREILYAKNWVVYAKRPFSTPAHVIEYLGRYTHKIAISNYRITKVDENHVFFKWKDYKHAAKQKTMKLLIPEFLRRFAMHILPHRFVRIRHYGILSFHGRSKIIPYIQQMKGFTPKILRVVVRTKTTNTTECEKCKSNNIVTTILPKQKNRDP